MISVHPDPDGEAVESCCFCRRPTKYWYRPRDVACCKQCAGHAVADDVPDKQTWCRREVIARGGR